jgi:uncharacterized protein (DUF2345 family)
MTESTIQTGTIIDASPGQGNSYRVQVSEDGSTLEGCVSLIGGFFAPLLGLRSNFKHAIGTNVLILRSAPAMILCELRSLAGVPASSRAHAATTAPTDAADLDPEDADTYPADPPPRDTRDLLPGELDLSNALQVGITWLTHVIKMRAGDRVKVECHLLDSLLRVMAENLQVITGAGDWTCTNDGGHITMRHNWTSAEHEAWGLKHQGDPKSRSTEGGLPQPTDVPETGRWRCSEFAGALGDMLHKFITDPEDSIGQLAQRRAGKLRQWEGADGTWLLQSVSDIVLERVTRIVVPVELKRPQDPTGDTAEEMMPPRADYLDIWKPDTNEPWNMAHHLRDYARWLSNYAGYARFLQRVKDWEVTSEAESPQPDLAAKDRAREAAVPAALRAPRETYATIRIMRDGSIVMLNGYGSSVMMAGYDLTVSAARDLRLEAGRNIVMTAGGSIFAKARKHMELVAVTGTFIASARARMALWTEQGTLLLRSLMKPSERGTPEAHRFGDNKVGLVISTPESKAVITGKEIGVEALSTDDSTTDPALQINSAGGMRLAAGKGRMLDLAGGAVRAMAENVVLQASKGVHLLSSFIDFGGVLQKASGKLTALTLHARNMIGSFIYHGQLMPGGSDNHRNHVGYSAGAGNINMAEGTAPPSEAAAAPFSEGRAASRRIRPVCDYLPVREYGTKPAHESLSQQVLRQHQAGNDNTEEWLFSDDAKNGDSSASYKKPYPGAGAQTQVYGSDANLHVPSSKLPGEHAPTPVAPTPQAASFITQL